MVKLNKLKLFIIFFEIIIGISASTHWIVTETGRIQSHVSLTNNIITLFIIYLFQNSG